MDLFLGGDLLPELHLDLLEAAGKRSGKDIQARLARVEAARSKSDQLAPYRETLVGGEAEVGKRLFFNKAELSCVRCHKINGTGGEVGPDLTGIGAKQKRDYLLEAIVLPSKTIAKGYETVVLTLVSGKTIAGILRQEDAREVQLMTPEGELLKVAKDQIEAARHGQVRHARGPGQAPVAAGAAQPDRVPGRAESSACCSDKRQVIVRVCALAGR